MNSAVNIRERFLQDAAASLSGPSPTSAEHLRRNALLIQALKDGMSQPSPSDICPACGSLDIDSREVEVESKRKTSLHGGPATTTEAAVRKLHVRRCRKCSRSVKHAVETAVPGPRKRTAEVQAEEEQPPTIDISSVHPQLPGAKASSKRRAKERKDREGLKAMMSKPKDKSDHASGFSLMDFMSSSGR